MESLLAITATPSIRLSLIFLASIASILLLTRLFTQWRYRRQLQQYLETSSSDKAQLILQPPQLPYTIPFLGNALSFLSTEPGLFFGQLFHTHPRETGAVTLNLGSFSSNIVFNPHSVNALFKDRQLSRQRTNIAMINKCFDVQIDQVKQYYSDASAEHVINKEFLLKTERVNELTTHFVRVLSDTLAKDTGLFPANKEIGLYSWLRDRMFTASTTALMGQHLLEMYPDLCTDFFNYDQEMLSFFFSIPTFLIRAAHKRRTKLLLKLEEWNRAMLAQCPEGKPCNSNGAVSWEPLYGSRLNRARQQFYANNDLTMKTRAGFDLGLLFGLSSNAIPATGWILMHLFSPETDATVYPRILAELKTAQTADGRIDVPTLITLPLLNSVFHEVLRLYTDVLVTRDVDHDIVLPLDEAGTRSVMLAKDSMVMAPSYLGQHDASVWNTKEAPVEVFYAERFLVRDAETGKSRFTLNNTTGKLFPFGGGVTMCPGRVFAKQEVLAAVAMVLLRFEFEFVGFVDGKGNATAKFPGLRSSFQGSGVMVADGDLRVKIRPRSGREWNGGKRL